MQTKKPQSIYEWMTYQDGEIRTMSAAEVKRMTIIRRKSWLIRCLRWAKWVRTIDPPQGDNIYHGKILPVELVMDKGRQRKEESENPDTWLRGELDQNARNIEIFHLEEMEMEELNSQGCS